MRKKIFLNFTKIAFSGAITSFHNIWLSPVRTSAQTLSAAPFQTSGGEVCTSKQPVSAACSCWLKRLKPGCQHVYFCCNDGHFSMAVYGD